MGLPVGGHIIFHAEFDGEVVSKKYTPVSLVNEKGKIEFVIKAYHPNDEFPSGGKMSVYLSKLNPGDKVKLEGPRGLLFYKGFGNFELRKKGIKKPKLGFIAGGTGITPCYQVIQASCLSKDGVSIKLLYSNKTINDVLVKEDLDNFQRVNSENF
jgi:NAD(P)H-flavin reductase